MFLKLNTAAFLTLSCLAGAANAQVVSEHVFLKNGGDLNNIAGTIAAANESLREKSYDPAFNAVGHISGCTATWLGDDAEWVYVLSAAHCNGASSDTVSTTAKFYADDDKTLIASGGTIHTVPQRNNRPAGYGGASTDLEILKLKKIAEYRDKNGKKVVKPVLYDGSAEKGLPVEFVGYGSWGVNVTSNGGYFPTSGQRRLTSMSVIDSIFEQDHGIGAGYEPVKESEKWGRTASGDSGSAWWQTHQNIKTIIAVTNGGGERSSTGARVSQYIDWIKSVYPEVDVLSEHAFDWNYSMKGTAGNLYFYDNPFNGDTEYFMLKNSTYSWFPTDKSNNKDWVYLGMDKKKALRNIQMLNLYKRWDGTNQVGKAEDLYIYFNPNNYATEIFSLKESGNYGYFPVNHRDNDEWYYFGDINFK
jgi:hypothetical protein